MEEERVGKQNSQRGQSLTEVALFLPIIMLIIVGLVEISNLIVVQSRAETAARIGARFGANGGEAQGIRIAALNALTQTLDLDEALWDMWVFEGTINISGTAFTIDSWNWDHIYGMGQTANFSSTNEITIQQQVLNDLRSQGDQNASELEVVGILMFHDVETILGLDSFIQGLNSVRGFAVMELAPGPTAVQTDACSGFPIILEYGQRSVNAASYAAIGDWEYPPFPNRPQLSSFPTHYEDVPLGQAPEGSVFHFTAPSNYPIAGGATNFDWLAWNTVDPDSTTDLEELQNSLAWPGNSISPAPEIAYVDPVTRLAGMHGMNPAYPATYDLVSKAPVVPTSADIGSIMAGHVDQGRSLRLLVWERDLSGGGADIGNNAYKIRGFIVGKIIGYQLNGSSSNHWLMVELISWETSCGVTIPGAGG